MNTPAHIAVNLFLLGKKENHASLWAVTIGAAVPDLPIIVFYIVQKLFLQTPEMIIWSQSYFASGWQIFFDIFSSFPLLLAGFLLAYWMKLDNLGLFFASMGLHGLADFLLHHDDAHRHFFPLSDWRFESPVSYWDPAHFGQFIAPLEALAVVLACYLLYRRFHSRYMNRFLGVIIMIYAVYWGYAIWMWT